jgi:chromosome partitioning protein
MPRIIAVVSHKGGTGKTSLVQNVGAEFAKSGERVLLIDFDPQSTLTMGCGLDPTEDRQTIYHAMTRPDDTAEIVVSFPSLDLLAANLDLAFAEQQFSGTFDRNDKLKDILSVIQDRYRYILIDSPPSLGFFAFNALMAANEVIVPLQCQPYAYKMLYSTLQLVELVKKTNADLRLRAIVLTMYDRRLTLTKSVEGAARKRYGSLVAQTAIPTNVSIAEATLDGVPVAEYAPNSTGARAYRALAKELTDG